MGSKPVGDDNAMSGDMRPTCHATSFSFPGGLSSELGSESDAGGLVVEGEFAE